MAKTTGPGNIGMAPKKGMTHRSSVGPAGKGSGQGAGYAGQDRDAKYRGSPVGGTGYNNGGNSTPSAPTGITKFADRVNAKRQKQGVFNPCSGM